MGMNVNPRKFYSVSFRKLDQKTDARPPEKALKRSNSVPSTAEIGYPKFSGSSKNIRTLRGLYMRNELSLPAIIHMCKTELKACKDPKKNKLPVLNMVIRKKWPVVADIFIQMNSSNDATAAHKCLEMAKQVLESEPKKRMRKMRKISFIHQPAVAFASVISSQDEKLLRRIIQSSLISDFKRDYRRAGSRDCVLRESKFSDSLFSYYQLSRTNLIEFLDTFYESFASDLLSMEKPFEDTKYELMINSAIDILLAGPICKFPKEVKRVYRRLYEKAKECKGEQYAIKLTASLFFRLTISRYFLETRKCYGKDEKIFTPEDMLPIIKKLKSEFTNFDEVSENTLVDTIRGKISRLIHLIIQKDTHT